MLKKIKSVILRRREKRQKRGGLCRAESGEEIHPDLERIWNDVHSRMQLLIEAARVIRWKRIRNCCII